MAPLLLATFAVSQAYHTNKNIFVRRLLTISSKNFHSLDHNSAGYVPWNNCFFFFFCSQQYSILADCGQRMFSPHFPVQQISLTNTADDVDIKHYSTVESICPLKNIIINFASLALKARNTQLTISDDATLTLSCPLMSEVVPQSFHIITFVFFSCYDNVCLSGILFGFLFLHFFHRGAEAYLHLRRSLLSTAAHWETSWYPSAASQRLLFAKDKNLLVCIFLHAYYKIHLHTRLHTHTHASKHKRTHILSQQMLWRETDAPRDSDKHRPTQGDAQLDM